MKQLIGWLLIGLLIAGVIGFLEHNKRTQGKVAAHAALPDAGFDWTVYPLEGPPVPFSSLKGKTIFVNFWATWCGPCREEMPAIERLYGKVKDNKNIVIIAASWEDSMTVSSFLPRVGWKAPIYYLFSRPAPASYSSEGIPVTFIISPDGKVVKKHIDPYPWDNQETVDLLLSLAR